MNKGDLARLVQEKLEISGRQAQSAVDTVFDAITDALKNADRVTVVGFGTFGVRKRAARTARNPRTGEPVQVPATIKPYFTPGQGLKDEVKRHAH